MALLGPAPAVVIGVACDLPHRWHRLPTRADQNGMNLMIVAVLGLAGGILFEVLRGVLGLGMADTVYAALVLPVYLAARGREPRGDRAAHPLLGPEDAGRPSRNPGFPRFRSSCSMGSSPRRRSCSGPNADISQRPALLAVLVVVIPLRAASWTGSGAATTSSSSGSVSDARAAEVARLASDRERLLSEVLEAEERERARLAESLHDGPMQRLVALRQDAAERATPVAADRWPRRRDLARPARSSRRSIPRPRASSASSASLRAAIAPVPALAAVRAERARHGRRPDASSGALLLRIAQELVVNAVKHARPSRIDVVSPAEGEHVVLEVNDDGVGIDTSDAGRAVQAGHVGLAMVRRRVEDAGGRFEIETRADGGTRSRVVLPIERPLRRANGPGA